MRAPLQITAKFEFQTGPLAGQRRFRLSSFLEWPPALAFGRALPFEGSCRVRIQFTFPSGPTIDAYAEVDSDPLRPDVGCRAVLHELTSEAQHVIQKYLEGRIMER